MKLSPVIFIGLLQSFQPLNHDEEENYLKQQKDHYLDELDYVDQKIYFLEDSENDLKRLKQERKLLDKEKDELKKIIDKGGIAALVKRKDQLYKDVNDFEKQKSKILGPKEQKESQTHELEKQIKNSRDKYKNKQSKITGLSAEIEKLEVKLVDWEEQKNTRIPVLQKKLTPIDGEINIYQTALSSLKKQEHEVDCPLCKTGKVSFPIVEKRLNELIDKKKNITNQIKEINMIITRLKIDYLF